MKTITITVLTMSVLLCGVIAFCYYLRSRHLFHAATVTSSFSPPKGMPSGMVSNSSQPLTDHEISTLNNELKALFLNSQRVVLQYRLPNENFDNLACAEIEISDPDALKTFSELFSLEPDVTITPPTNAQPSLYVHTALYFEPSNYSFILLTPSNQIVIVRPTESNGSKSG